MKILHITPHLGGGVGNFISKLILLDKEYIHHVLLLEAPKNQKFVDPIEDLIILNDSNINLKRLLPKYDIVILHWWHHPKTSKFLFEMPQLPVRMLIWSHISNLTVPALNGDFFKIASRIIFSTPASINAEIYKHIPDIVKKKKSAYIYTCPGFEDVPFRKRPEKTTFNIGYFGSIDFAKLHPEFVEFCNSVKLEDAIFLLVGDSPAKDIITKQAKEANLLNRLYFLGFADNIWEKLNEFDVLGYPLMPEHTCTTENSILEAMAFGIPPVLLNQLTEKYIIKNGETGFLVSNFKEYGEIMRYLYYHPKTRIEIGKNAKEHVLRKYSTKNLLDAFRSNCEICLKEPKISIDFSSYFGKTPAEWFFYNLGKDKAIFECSFQKGINNQTNEIKESLRRTSNLLKQPTKASVHHYSREFQDDEMLKMWSYILNEDSFQN